MRGTRLRYIGYRVRGFNKMVVLANQYLNMSKTTKIKLDTLAFARKHGVAAALDHTRISRATFYEWQRRFREGGVDELANNYGYQPKRSNTWPPALITKIRSWRQQRPNIGAGKLVCLLPEWCQQRGLPLPSQSTLSRIIADDPDKMRCKPSRSVPKRPRHGAPRERKDTRFVAGRRGECVAFDTLVRIVDGRRFYWHVGIDLFSRFSLVSVDTSAASASSARLFTAMQNILGTRIEKVLTDNGSEFAKDFHRVVTANGSTHWYTYPRKPQMNAHCERFNRTLWEEFGCHMRHLLVKDMPAFNAKLIEWLAWYNLERPHYALKQLSPIQFLQKQQKSRNGWDHTKSKQKLDLGYNEKGY